MSTATAPLTDGQKRDAVNIARKERARIAERVAAYRRECADAAAEGYRPSHCIHGTYLWVDYDPICAGCEDWGFNGLDPLEPYHFAIAEVRERQRITLEAVAALTFLERENLMDRAEVDDVIRRLGRRIEAQRADVLR